MTGQYSGESGRKASATAIVERIDRTREKLGVSTTGDQNRTLDWNDSSDRQIVRQKFRDNGDVDEAILPGFGSEGLARNARDDCGEVHPFICDNCGHAVEFGRTCSQSVCTRCGAAWVRDTAIKKAAKIRRVRREKHQHTHGAEHQKIHHAVISAPLSWYYDLARAGYTLKEAQQKTKPIVKDILDELRSPGILIRHSYRGESDDGSIRTEADDRGIWKERLNSGRDFYGDVRDQLAWMPHYHCIVVADYLKGGDLVQDVEEATGWVIHRIADEDTGVSLQDDGAMARALTYCLSHADIDVRDGHNRSAVWEIGSFQGDAIKSSSRFSARPSDLDWADNCVRRIAQRVLGLRSGSTECGASIPPVDNPDELAHQILEEMYPQDDPPLAADTDAVLHQVSEGNISVDVSTTSGGGGDIIVRDAFGHTVGDAGWGDFDSDTWSTPSTSTTGEPVGVSAIVDAHDQDEGDKCEGSCDGDHDASSSDTKCDGQLIPLGEVRNRGLLDDPNWCRAAAHVEEAREADLEWSDDLEPWRTSSPDNVNAIGAG